MEKKKDLPYVVGASIIFEISSHESLFAANSTVVISFRWIKYVITTARLK